jgi:hypothetical protein
MIREVLTSQPPSTSVEAAAAAPAPPSPAAATGSSILDDLLDAVDDWVEDAECEEKGLPKVFVTVDESTALLPIDGT